MIEVAVVDGMDGMSHDDQPMNFFFFLNDKVSICVLIAASQSVGALW